VTEEILLSFERVFSIRIAAPDCDSIDSRVRKTSASGTRVIPLNWEGPISQIE
jgi:hypothetical protein